MIDHVTCHVHVTEVTTSFMPDICFRFLQLFGTKNFSENSHTTYFSLFIDDCSWYQGESYIQFCKKIYA